MGIGALLRRWGFVRLADYGLEMTAENRIRARRWVVLDDGSGGAVVGWSDDDARIGELRKWQLVPPSTAAKPKDTNEDEWEWMLAAARARESVPAPESIARGTAPISRQEPDEDVVAAAPATPGAIPPASRTAPRPAPHTTPPAQRSTSPAQGTTPPAQHTPAQHTSPAAQRKTAQRTSPAARTTEPAEPEAAAIPDDLPTTTWLEGHTEIDPPEQLPKMVPALAASVVALPRPPTRAPRGTPAPGELKRTPMRTDPWQHEATVPTQPPVPRPTKRR